MWTFCHCGLWQHRVAVSVRAQRTAGQGSMMNTLQQCSSYHAVRPSELLEAGLVGTFRK